MRIWQNPLEALAWRYLGASIYIMVDFEGGNDFRCATLAG